MPIAPAAGFCAWSPRPVRVAYEAGSIGYGLARELANGRRIAGHYVHGRVLLRMAAGEIGDTVREVGAKVRHSLRM